VTDTARIKTQDPTKIKHLLLYDPNWIPSSSIYIYIYILYILYILSTVDNIFSDKQIPCTSSL